MQAKTETHGFTQYHLQEPFCQSSTEKIIINVVQLPLGTVQPVPLVPLALSYWAALDWKVVTLGKRIWGLSCLFSFPTVYFCCTSAKWACGFRSSGAGSCGGGEDGSERQQELPRLLIPAFPQGTSPTFPGCLENRKQVKGQCDHSCHDQMV